jgi:DNA processing protein
MPIVKPLTLTGTDIPERLRHIHDAPKELFYRGCAPLAELIAGPTVAIVGSRKVDAYGAHVTKLLAGDLAKKGIIIVSGLALGVDGLAHQAALDAGAHTIAVLACGIDDIYPRTNYALGKAVIARGATITEHEGSYNPYQHDFLIRNRIISGLSNAVIVTQAAARSGSLNTASHALEQGRLVLAVPGPINSPLCEGPNNLLKMGATPVTCAEDVLRALNISTKTQSKPDYSLLAQNEHELKLIQLLLAGDNDGEILAAKSGLSAQQFNVHLTMLEIRGIISPLGGNQWTLS